MPHSIKHVLPDFADELTALLVAAGKQDLAAQVPELEIVDRCRCGDDFCATFYTRPKPQGSYGAGHQNIVLGPKSGELILDIADGTIVCVEVLYRDEGQNLAAERRPPTPRAR
jgi:hypothetical protein